MRSNILFFLLIFSFLKLEGQDISILHKMRQDSAIDLYLTLDWKTLEKKRTESTYLPGQLLGVRADGDSVYCAVKVKTRGHMRLGICSYPPVKLKFDKNELARNACSSMNEIDLVQPCHHGDNYDQYLLREYLAYKLYQLISPYSFEVQLVRLHTFDQQGEEVREPGFGFLVENEEELVNRFGGKRIKTATISKNAVERASFLRVCLFQFMIGNTDWYIPTRHNLDFIGIPGHSLLVTVPFDFDYSGLVSAPYAAHHETLRLSNVIIRYYQGWCESPEEVKNAIRFFLDKKEEILSMPSRIQGMSDKSANFARSYLEEFFTIIENPKKLENHIIEHCDMWPVAN